MARQSKEESQIMWKMELETAKRLDLTPEHSALITLVTTKIEDYTLTYDEYVKDIADYLETASDDELPREVIKNMCNYLIQKYGHQKTENEDSPVEL